MEVNLISPIVDCPQAIKSDLLTILLDGAHKHKNAFKNSLTVGDGDSHKDGNDDFDVKLSTNKDHSDLKHGLNLIPKEVKIIHAYGLWSNNMAHSLANLGELNEFLLHNDSEIHFYIDEKAVAIAFNRKIETMHNGKFSLISLQENSVSIEGNVKYKTDPEYPYFISNCSSQFISNEASGNFKINTSKPIILTLE